MAKIEHFVNGLILSALAISVAFLIAFIRYRNLYHFSILLWVFGSLYLLAAWIIHGRRTRLTNPPDTKTACEQEGESEPEKNNRVRGFLVNPIPALFWSALQLIALTLILYKVFGVGAAYYV